MSPPTSKPRPVLAQPYSTLFMIIEPSIIFLAILSIIIDPSSHFQSMGPDQCSAGGLQGAAAAALHNDDTHECLTPQIRALQYYFISALAFSAVIEPVMLYTATQLLQNRSDSLMVVKAVLGCFAVFDVFHSVAAVAGGGWEAVMPGSGTFMWEVGVNFWVPLAWFGVRGCWFRGARGEAKKRKERVG